MANNPVAAAPLAASAGGGGGNSGSSPWWIIGPLLALLAAMALATLAYTMKKKRDQRKQNKDPNSKEKSGRALDKLDDPGKEHVENLSARARERSTDNASLRIIETETKLGEHGDPVPMANLGKGKFIVQLIVAVPLSSTVTRLYRLRRLQSSFSLRKNSKTLGNR